MSCIVIETIEHDKIHWGVSFRGPNPEPEHYFEMPDSVTAFRLADYLSETSPVPSNNPKSPEIYPEEDHFEGVW